MWRVLGEPAWRNLSIYSYPESMYEDGRELAIQGRFTFVALDEDKKPIPVLEGLNIS